MAYDQRLAARIDAAVHDWPGLSTRRMFGSVGWMLDGNICAGIWKDSLIVRCGPAEWPKRLREPHVAEFDITGRSMKGWVLVRPAGMATADALAEWLRCSRDFVRTLPAKPAATTVASRAARTARRPLRAR